MPLLDVMTALTSPYIVDYFVVQRRQDFINSKGRSVPIVVQFNAVSGVVRPAGKNMLERSEEKQIQPKSIQISTTFLLRSASLDPSSGQAYQPDLIIWNGDNYIVKELRDSANYAAGFTKALCESTDLLPTPSNQVAAMLPMRAQIYTPTVLSPTLLTLPGNLNSPGLVLFRDGILISQQKNDYTLSLVNGVLNITLTSPLQAGETILAYA